MEGELYGSGFNQNSSLSLGMKLSAIAERTKINAIDLSRFKNGQIYLKKDNAERLHNYLKKVNIPE